MTTFLLLLGRIFVLRHDLDSFLSADDVTSIAPEIPTMPPSDLSFQLLFVVFRKKKKFLRDPEKERKKIPPRPLLRVYLFLF